MNTILKNLIKEYLDDDVNKIHLPAKLNPKVIDIFTGRSWCFFILHDEDGNVIYLDKTKNIREHIFAFFSKKPTEKYKQQLHAEICDISFELTGNELVASLVENCRN